MASSSDGTDQSEHEPVIDFSSMRQPPLIKQLKGILSEYPDGGQILKELIQNAEDADAKVVKILFDGRILNTEQGINTSKYRRFFKGPALCVYNDGVFTDKDWEGIRMIYSSVKEDDPLKVGRFGLGFKSVFHITDFPCVISGEKLLMVDPQELPDKVNAMINVSEMDKLQHKGFNSEDFWKAFDGTFGLFRDTLNSTGRFDGTLFWFPLREEKSKLSETLYNETKVFDLFDSLSSEASSILLFLKNIEQVTVYTREKDVTITYTREQDNSSNCSADSGMTTMLNVQIEDPDGRVRQNRSKFKEKIKTVTKNYSGDDISNEYIVTVKTTSNSSSTETKWLVANYFVGNSASPEFRRLIEDESIVYSPYVGVAAPIGEARQFEGHVFCFLPLPKEGSKLTGLPVHVNGFFALSQNRHHLKWETEEQKGKKIDDKSILWNKRLIQEAIPKAYGRLIQKVIQLSKNEGNSEQSVAAVYACLPDSDVTKANWKFIEEDLFRKMKKQKFLYCKSKNIWITATEACFATFSNLLPESENIKDAVIRCLERTGKSHVTITESLLRTLARHFAAVKDLSPDLLAKIIRQHAEYKNTTNEDKLLILEYLFSDNKFYEKVVELELLPLASGKWINFKKKADIVFVCSDEEVDVLSGLEQRLCRRSFISQGQLGRHIQEICKKGIFQIRELSATTLSSLLKETIEVNLGHNPCVSSSSKIGFVWLKAVWSYIAKCKSVTDFKEISILPNLQRGTWGNPVEVNLITLTRLTLVKTSQGKSLPDSVCRCFEAMGITIIDILPDWISRDIVKHDLYWPTPKSVSALLEHIESKDNMSVIIDNFNSECKSVDKPAFVTCLVKCTEIQKCRNFLRLLKIFPCSKRMKEPGPEASISEITRYTKVTDDFPEGISFPYPCLIAAGPEEALLGQLGAKEIQPKELLLQTLKSFEQQDFQNTEEFPKLMEFLINRFHIFEKEEKILQYAAKVPFLRTGNERKRPSELFDPSDNILSSLLHGENLLPETKKKLSSETIRILKFLGLKSIDNINEEILLRVATTLDEWTKEEETSREIEEKAHALLHMLCLKPFLLKETCKDGRNLEVCLKSLFCMPVIKNKPASYPESVRWHQHVGILCRPDQAREVSLSLLVGAVMPVLECSSTEVNNIFGWKSDPEVEVVVDQLKILAECYTVEQRPEFLHPLKRIYEHLNQIHKEVWKMKHCTANAEVVWTGSKFTTAKQIIVLRNAGDVDLNPYFYSVPEDFLSMQRLFLAFDCHQKQDFTILSETLKKIQETHSQIQNEHDLKRDRQIVCNILEKISKLIQRKEINVNDAEILMMVRSDDPNALKLLPVYECTYDDDPTCYFNVEGNIHLVHELIPMEVIETLGVKSISTKALNEAEDFGVEWGQLERLTTRIRTLLNEGYTDGLSVPKELIQNADDAGASVVKFLYDERQNTSYKQRVFSKGMRHYQGPALWVYNDATFTEDDLKNITKLNAATKKSDERKIGKFGLGFCSVYNLTDVPSFVSGRNIVFFDPHERNLRNDMRKRGTGLKYKFPNRTLIARYCDQFMPYKDIFGCKVMDDTFEHFDGTLFRLPLRTEQQSKESEICTVPYTNEEMTTLLCMLMKSAGNLLLFTQNVKTVEIYHLPETCTSGLDSTLVYRISKEMIHLNDSFLNDRHNDSRNTRANNGNEKVGITNAVGLSVLSRLPEMIRNNDTFLEIHKAVFKLESHVSFEDFSLALPSIYRNETTWIISWATGTKQSLQLYKEMKADGAIPIAAVALPFLQKPLSPLSLKELSHGFYRDGHVFCFLPLPLKTKLPVHINACFAVTSDRRKLLAVTEDDKQTKNYSWNVAVLEDAVVEAYTLLLQLWKNPTFTFISERSYYNLWPLVCASFAVPLKEAFFTKVIEENVEIFKGQDSWVSFKKVAFLEPKLRKSDIGDIAVEMLTHFPVLPGKSVVDIPDDVLQNIKTFNKAKLSLISSSEITEQEFFKCFFETLESSYWNERIEQRNAVIARALSFDNKEIMDIMRRIKCIPTEPSYDLAQPSDLIHPNSQLASLFCEKEGKFPSLSDMFRNEQSLTRLVFLGMNISRLPPDLLVDRCDSILQLSRQCSGCCMERLLCVVKYLSQGSVLKDIGAKHELVEKIRQKLLMPVLPKPEGWAFEWHSSEQDSSSLRIQLEHNCQQHSSKSKVQVLGKSELMFRQHTKEYVGMTSLILDEHLLTRVLQENAFFQFMGIRDIQDIPIDLLASQAEKLVNGFTDEKQIEDMSRIHDKVLKQMNRMVQLHEDHKCLEKLQNSPCILIGTKLVHPEKVAVNCKEECRPYLYRLPETDRLSKLNIYTLLGVEEIFNIQSILEVMDLMREKKKVVDIDLVNYLLIDLSEILEWNNWTYESLKQQYHERILAPDISGELWPTYKLVTQNDDFMTTFSLKVLHPLIAPQLGEKLGVKPKQMRCFEEIRFGVSFGQREKLVTRIKGLLKAYPCDFSIMKELLQNADDAGASEIHFIKDYRVHSKENLFQESCDFLQGPALCVYNNSYFTEKDIEGIHNLGQGSKSDDPTKTGQYGVGFNAVYHLTDTPSFLTKGPGLEEEGRLFIFDPSCEHVPKATVAEPGLMCKVQDVKENFPNHLLGFSLDDLLPGTTGTLFRFPLRSKKSDISNEVINNEQLDGMLKAFETDTLDAVLFLKNIRQIKVLNISSGTLRTEYSVKVNLTVGDDEKLRKFNESMQEIAKQNAENKYRNLEISPTEVIYQLSVDDSRHNCKNWLIVQRYGIQRGLGNLPELISSFKAGDLGLLPVGGVAIPLSTTLKSCLETVDTKIAFDQSNKSDNKKPEPESAPSSQKLQSESREAVFCGKAFCFLPLPVQTGLPVHINGHFALDHEARRELWNEGYRHSWNQCLAEFNIVPSWISGMQHLAENLTPSLHFAWKWREVNAILHDFHAAFPLPSVTKSEFWKKIAFNFFHYIVNKEVNIFPSVFSMKDKLSCPDICQENNNKNFLVRWVTISTDITKRMDGVFNVVGESLPEWCSIKESRLIVSMLKSFRMRLIETPVRFKKAMEDAGIRNVPSSNPHMANEFLQTHIEHTDWSCEVGDLDKQITHSKYQSSDNLYIFVKYLMLDSEFFNQLNGLPILLTADGIIRACSKTTPVFISQYSALLPTLCDMFIHKQFQTLLHDSRVFETGCFREFGFQDFVNKLPLFLNSSVYANGCEIEIKEHSDEIEKGNTIRLEWLEMFYDFLYEESLETEIIERKSTMKVDLFRSEPVRKLSMSKFENFLHALGDWSFLPCSKSNSQLLLPLNQRKLLMVVSYKNRQEILGKTLLKLSLPTLSTNVFKNCKAGKEIKSSMEMLVSSPDKPVELLECLVHYKVLVKNSSLNTDEGTEILGFFARVIDVLKTSAKKEIIVNLLRQLPLFLTQQSSLTSLDDDREVLVLPRGMPQSGVQTWASSCKITLLQEKETLTSLHEFLGLQKADQDYVYGNKILPNFNAMPEEHRMEHIRFLKEGFSNTYLLSDKKQKILNALKQIAFISVQGLKKKVSELYDPKNKLFAAMKAGSDFLPEEYMTEDWRDFLKKLGLITKVNDEMIVEFARQIESLGGICIGDDLRRKSRLLLQHLAKDEGTNWRQDTLSRIRTIKFLEPSIVEDKYKQLYPQPNDGNTLIRFEESVSSDQKNLCWTTVDLVSQDVVVRFSPAVRKTLHICEKASLDKISHHCINICFSLKSKLATTTDEKFVTTLMTSVYEYFDNCKDQELITVKQQLDCKPFVHLPDEKEMVSLDVIVPDLNSYMQIKPYLYRASTYYGKYFKLFERLGSKNKIMFCHYANILRCIKESAKDKEMSPPEKMFVQKAFNGLLALDIENDVSVNDISALFLPTKHMVLINSQQIVVSNNHSFERRLEKHVSIPICADMAFLGKKSPLVEDIIVKWPQRLRPKLLTDIVKEEVSFGTNREQQIIGSVKARKIQSFLHSDEMCIGLCRLLKQQFALAGKISDFNANVCEVEISTRLRNISVVQLSTLRTVLKYNGEIVQGSEMDIFCYVKRESDIMAGPCVLYFKDRSNTESIDITSISCGLISVIIACVANFDVRSSGYVNLIVYTLESANTITEVLDQNGIHPYSSAHFHPKEYFPKPGTYVEPQFIPFLEQSIEPFKDFEFDYVAMELEDASLESDRPDDDRSPVFIYVKILREISTLANDDAGENNLRLLYLVETGNKNIPTETVPIYRLYRFIRKEVSDSHELEVRTGTPRQDNLPFDEKCRQIREQLREAWRLPKNERKAVIKRILLQWHPDKNLGNEQYCTKVFQYIQIVLSRLENEESLIHDANEEMSRGPSQFSRESSDFFDFVFRRGKTYASAYHDNYESYCRSEKTGQYSHSSAQQPPARRDFEEATRWLRQAKFDYQAALSMRNNDDSIHSYNWTCFICYQSSENALRAACYARNANQIPQGTDLSSLGTTPALTEQARRLTARVGNPARMRYPDLTSRPRVPSEIFTQEDADFCLQTTRTIIELAEDFIESR